jgi:hypothetical protein
MGEDEANNDTSSVNITFQQQNYDLKIIQNCQLNDSNLDDN